MFTVPPPFAASNSNASSNSTTIDDDLGILYTQDLIHSEGILDLEAIGHPATWSVAFVAIVLNVLVIVVIFHQREKQKLLSSSEQQQQRKSRSLAQIRLLFLAFSDLTVGVVFVAGAIWNWTLDVNLLLDGKWH